MIQLVPQLRIFLAYQPVDFRKGIDGLVALCRRELSSDAMDGAVYVFRNRRWTALKILNFDGHGFWLSGNCLTGIPRQAVPSQNPGLVERLKLNDAPFH